MFGSKFQLENPYLQIDFAFDSAGGIALNEAASSFDLGETIQATATSPTALTLDVQDGFTSELRVDFMGQGNDTLIDSVRGLIYISTDSGEILRYDIEAEAFLSSVQLGGTLQGLALSQDGNTLVVADVDVEGDLFSFDMDTVSRFHTVNLDTLETNTVFFDTGPGSGGVSALTVDENDTVLILANAFGGGSFPVRRFADLGNNGEISSFDFLPVGGSIEVTASGDVFLAVGGNNSSAPHALYSTATGDVIASGNLFDYASVTSGFNRDLNAISGEAQRVVLSFFNDIILLDFNFNLVTNLSSFQSAGQIAGNAFSAEGVFLFLWDSDLDALIVYDHANETVVTQIDLESDIGFRANSGNFGDIKVSEDGLTLVLDTGNAFEVVDLSEYADLLTVVEFGDSSDDIFRGEFGDDTLVGRAGDDVLYGGRGDDRLFGGAGDDMIDGGTGDDFILGGTGMDILLGGDGDDNIVGHGADDMIDGGAGRDFLEGGNGDDLILGGSGNDALFGGADNDRLEGGDGNDYLGGGAGADLLIAGQGADRLYAGSGDDQLYGQQGDDLIFGGGGDDILHGQAGDDSLSGDRGLDTLTGGAGDDVFIFTRISDTDIVTDFTDGQDMLDLSDFTDQDIQTALDTANDMSGDTVLTFSGGQVLILEGITADQISADDILNFDGIA